MTRTRAKAGASRVAGAIVAFAVLAVSTGAAAGAQVEAPQRGEPFAVVWMTVGGVVEVDVSSGFVGSIESYSARSDNAGTVLLSTAGSIVSLTAVGEGVAFVEVTATNAGGSLSQWIGVVSAAGAPPTATGDGQDVVGPPADESTIPDDDPPADSAPLAADDPRADDASPLGIAVAAPAFCYAPKAGEMHEEGFDSDSALADRARVGKFDLSYSVVGGRPPFVIASPSLGGTTSARSGVLELACAYPAPRVAESTSQQYYEFRVGPVTLAIEVSDADGQTARAELVVHMSTGTVRVNNADGTESAVLEVLGLTDPGRSYVLGTPTAWTLVALAPGLNIRFERLDTEDVAHFADPDTGWEVRLDWITGTEVGRTAGAIPETNPLILGTWQIPNDDDVRDMSPGDEGDMSPPG